jgi:predicted HicB family RNase H-like nuclease
MKLKFNLLNSTFDKYNYQMNNILSFKGFIGSVEIDLKNKILFGQVQGIHDVVKYSSPTTIGIKQEFQFSVKKYLSSCKALGKRCTQIQNGFIRLNITPDLHQKISKLATMKGISLNQLVQNALLSPLFQEDSLIDRPVPTVLSGAFLAG